MSTKITPTRYEDSPALHMAGLKRTYTFDKIYEIGQLWPVFSSQMTDHKVTYGVSLKNGTENGFDYMAAIEREPTGDLPEGWTQVSFPAQRYAVYTHEGHVDGISNTINGIMSGGLEDGYEMTADPIMFERYGLNFNDETMSGDVEIWIPVKEKSA